MTGFCSNFVNYLLCTGMPLRKFQKHTCLLAPEAIVVEGLQDENETGFCTALSTEQRMRELLIVKIFKLFVSSMFSFFVKSKYLHEEKKTCFKLHSKS
jgi:hypothetical protein